MIERDVTPELLLQVIDEGEMRHSDEARLRVWLDVPGHHDKLLCAVRCWCWNRLSSSGP